MTLESFVSEFRTWHDQVMDDLLKDHQRRIAAGVSDYESLKRYMRDLRLHQKEYSRRLVKGKIEISLDQIREGCGLTREDLEMDPADPGSFIR